jgi:hypothetical protein
VSGGEIKLVGAPNGTELPESDARETCGSCQFYSAAHKVTAPDGSVKALPRECRAHAPQSLATLLPPRVQGGQPGVYVTSYFPQTTPESWCGEWQGTPTSEH